MLQSTNKVTQPKNCSKKAKKDAKVSVHSWEIHEVKEKTYISKPLLYNYSWREETREHRHCGICSSSGKPPRLSRVTLTQMLDSISNVHLHNCRLA